VVATAETFGTMAVVPATAFIITPAEIGHALIVLDATVTIGSPQLARVALAVFTGDTMRSLGACLAFGACASAAHTLVTLRAPRLTRLEIRRTETVIAPSLVALSVVTARCPHSLGPLTALGIRAAPARLAEVVIRLKRLTVLEHAVFTVVLLEPALPMLGMTEFLGAIACIVILDSSTV